APRQVAGRTAPVRSHRDRQPGSTPSKVRRLDPTLAPLPALPKASPQKKRVPGPEDTILESASLAVDATKLREELAGLYEVSPHRYIPTVLTPRHGRSALARAETHFMSTEPQSTVTFASVMLSIFIGVLVTLAVLYQFL